MSAPASPRHPAIRPSFLFILIACLLALVARAQAQIPSLDEVGGGTRFIVAFPDTVGNLLDPRFPNTLVSSRFDICIYSGVAENPVRITRGNGSRSTVTPLPGRFSVVQVSPDPAITTLGVVDANTITVESLYPVVIYCVALTSQGMDAWTPLPVERWGTSYAVASLPGDRVVDIGMSLAMGQPAKKRPAPAEIVAIAAHNATHVTIVAGRGQRFADGSSSLHALLNAGQCIQVQSYVDTSADFEGDQADMAGVQVTADHPIGVISGNTRSLVWPSGEGLLMNAYKNAGLEWLAPTDEHGREFVYMPSWDSHRPGLGSPAERAGEIVRIYGTAAPSTSFSVRPQGSADTSRGVARDTMVQLDLPATRAVSIRTSAPSQVYMHSSSIVQLVSRTPYFNRFLETYAGWAPYMVELVPREQWSSFAPYYTPMLPMGMLHYINVVTDTASARRIVDENGKPFPFQWSIPGTDLIWGSMMLGGGETHHLIGRDGARFGGFVYGFYQGGEDYVPATRTRKRDERELAMSELRFKEYSALSYAYPLIARRNVLAPPDHYTITSTAECARTLISIHATDSLPAGIRSVTLDPALSSNVRLIPIVPADIADVAARPSVEVGLAPIDPLLDARGRLVVYDRTGSSWFVSYVYQAPGIDASTDSLDLGECSTGLPADTVITITNPLDADLMIDAVALDAVARGFTIVGTLPDGPAATPSRPVTLRKGETLAVRVRLNAPVAGDYRASLAVTFGCASIVRRVPLHASVAEPIISLPDLSFGTLPLGSGTRTSELSICNVGRGRIVFGPPVADSALELRGEGFAVARGELDRLRGASIGPGECFILHVSFTPTRPGTFTARARFLDNARRLRDTSIWSATVSADAGVEPAERAGYFIGSITPNPTVGAVTIPFTLGVAGWTTLTISDGLGKVVAAPVDEMQGAGEHRAAWDASGAAAGIYYCRITSGGWSAVRPIVVVR